MEYVNTPGATRTLSPQAVVLLNPTDGHPYAATASTVADSTGADFAPDDCVHTYGYSAGLLVTDTATHGANTWVKTYSYTAGKLATESNWVKQ